MTTEESPLEFMTKAKFSKIVEQVSLEKSLSYIDAVLYACEQNGIDLEDSKKYVSNVIKSKLEAEAMSLNYIGRKAELPFE